jgi:hypothetical protein
MLNLITDVVISILILVSFTLAVNVKDNFTNKNRKDKHEIADNDLTILSKCDNIFWGYLSSNHYAVELLKKRFEYEKGLSDAEYNRLPFNHKIDWVQISRNEKAIDIIKERIEYENYLGEEYKYQETPYMIDTLNKINWKCMTRNPNAIELLRERIKYEKTLSKEKYIKLSNRINWDISMVEAKNPIILLKDLLIE